MSCSGAGAALVDILVGVRRAACGITLTCCACAAGTGWASAFPHVSQSYSATALLLLYQGLLQCTCCLICGCHPP
jgi:hypothetical protein